MINFGWGVFCLFFRKLLAVKIIYTISFLILCFQSFSQDSLNFFQPEISFDTINQKDSTGLNQGYWIIFGINKPEKGFPDSLRIEEGKLCRR